MNRKIHWNSNYTVTLQLVLHLIWMSFLSHAESYIICYVVVGAASLFSLYHNQKRKSSFSGWQIAVLLLLSFVFSLTTVLSNYAVLWNVGALSVLLFLLGGMAVCWNISVYLYQNFPLTVEINADRTSPKQVRKVFLLAFVGIAAIDLFYLFFVEYPGNISPDSVSQINQALTGKYSNHHPYWHTVVIREILNIGFAMFGNYTDAVALYSVCQALFVAVSFSYVVVTLYQVGVSVKVILVAYASYLLSPYHINYSIMMWKDVVFSCAVLTFTVSLYRLLKNIGKCRWMNYLVFALSSIGFGVWRTNGFPALAASFLLFLIFAGRKQKKTVLLWAVTIVMAWFMRGPYLASKDISQPDLVEALSIPVQQVARVFADGYIVSPEETQLLDRVINVDEIPQLYMPTLSDPIKNAIRAKDNAYFESNIREYFHLWIELGKRFPTQYFRAWVDQTKGYWNSGYLRGVVLSILWENDWGIQKTLHGTPFADWFIGVLDSFQYNNIFNLLFSIGFHVWILGFLFLHGCLRKRTEALLCVPNIMIVGTLILTTPVAYDLRYAYSVFVCIPFLIVVSLYEQKPN